MAKAMLLLEEMPARCMYCPMRSSDGMDNMICGRSGEEIRDLDKRLENCELIEVEDDPADAISRKAMLEYNESLHGRMSNELNYEIYQHIKSQAAVVPKHQCHCHCHSKED